MYHIKTVKLNPSKFPFVEIKYSKDNGVSAQEDEFHLKSANTPHPDLVNLWDGFKEGLLKACEVESSFEVFDVTVTQITTGVDKNKGAKLSIQGEVCLVVASEPLKLTGPMKYRDTYEDLDAMDEDQYRILEEFVSEVCKFIDGKTAQAKLDFAAA